MRQTEILNIMKTKCIVLGEEQERNDKFKPIEFKWFIKTVIDDTEIFPAEAKPSNYENIELVKKSFYSDAYDLMFAYHSDRSHGLMYLGHWNDGVATKQG